MNDYLWVSTAMTDPALVARLNSDVVERDKAVSYAAGQLIKAGKSVPEAMCPKRLWLREDPDWAENPDPKPFAPISNLFVTGAYWIVSERAAAVLARFNLGGGALYPVSDGLFEFGNQVRMPGDYFTWIFGNVKSAFLPNETSNKRKFGTGTGGYWNFPWELADEEIAVSIEANKGSDVWIDPALFQSIFLSKPLGDALDAAGLRSSFRLFRCRVI